MIPWGGAWDIHGFEIRRFCQSKDLPYRLGVGVGV